MSGLLGENEATPFAMPPFLPTQQPIPSLKPFADPASHASSHAPPRARRPEPSNDAADGHLQALIGMGFNKDQSQAALEAASYDFQNALDLLVTVKDYFTL
jgi:Holliday junction resolvasome RuvABC DNA-binding subunit